MRPERAPEAAAQHESLVVAHGLRQRSVIPTELAPCGVGLSGAICVVSDLLGLCSLHVLYLYRAARGLYAAHLAMLTTMYNLFRGRKYNLLRRRTDSCEYDLEQQLLGTPLRSVTPRIPAL